MARTNNYLRASVVATVVLLAAVLLTLAVQPAKAAFPGNNGRIAFQSTRDLGGSPEIFSMNPDGSSLQQLTDGPAGSTIGSNSTNPAYSPDGSRIVFIRNKNIYVMNSDGTNQRQVTTDGANNLDPVWSPDGTQIAFTSQRGGSHLEVWRMNADGTGAVQLTNNTYESGKPVWSPDGTKIAVQNGASNGGDIYVINASDGSGAFKLELDGVNEDNTYVTLDADPSYSPDGSKIVWIHGTDVYEKNSDGSGTQVRLLKADSTHTYHQPAPSPDGTRLAVMAVQGGGTSGFEEVYVGNADGTGMTNVTNNAAGDRYPDGQPIPACTITGTTSNDTLTGTAGKDIICAGAGNDIINGAGGNDIILGGGGNDRMIGGLGNDTLNGGPGTDTASYSNSTALVRASLTTGFATGQGSDVLLGVENLTGSNLADVLTGSTGANVLSGLGGNDLLRGKDGISGNDTVDGGTGTDTCTRDAGDVMRNCP